MREAHGHGPHVFSPYDSPYQAFINYQNVVNDLTQKAMQRARR